MIIPGDYLYVGPETKIEVIELSRTKECTGGQVSAFCNVWEKDGEDADGPNWLWHSSLSQIIDGTREPTLEEEDKS